jgi:hypothetical protein
MMSPITRKMEKDGTGGVGHGDGGRKGGCWG